jgi:hypothetical protein
VWFSAWSRNCGLQNRERIFELTYTVRHMGNLLVQSFGVGKYEPMEYQRGDLVKIFPLLTGFPGL